MVSLHDHMLSGHGDLAVDYESGCIAISGTTKAALLYDKDDREGANCCAISQLA